jgi:hypothetical protein
MSKYYIDDGESFFMSIYNVVAHEGHRTIEIPKWARTGKGMWQTKPDGTTYQTIYLTQGDALFIKWLLDMGHRTEDTLDQEASELLRAKYELYVLVDLLEDYEHRILNATIKIEKLTEKQTELHYKSNSIKAKIKELGGWIE